MTLFNSILLIVLAVETIYIAKSTIKDLNKVLKFYRLTRQFNAIGLLVTKAKVLAEQGKHNECLQTLDNACAQIIKVSRNYTTLIKQTEK